MQNENTLNKFAIKGFTKLNHLDKFEEYAIVKKYMEKLKSSYFE
jgi:hypothetical protein